MQQITIVGNIGQAPVARTLASGREIMTFSVAVNSSELNNPIWYGIVMRKQDGVMPYLIKGRMVAICGELVPRVYNGQLDLTIYADKLTLCGGRGDAANSNADNTSTFAQDGKKEDQPDNKPEVF